MTKTQVKNKINKLIKDATYKLIIDVENVLHDADMWYGDGTYGILNRKNHDDRNGDQFVHDGILDKDSNVDHWLHTRKEVGLFDGE